MGRANKLFGLTRRSDCYSEQSVRLFQLRACPLLPVLACFGLGKLGVDLHEGRVPGRCRRQSGPGS
jgi:hypothetical protein